MPFLCANVIHKYFNNLSLANLKGYIESRRPVGRPKGWWLYAVDRDAKRMLKCRIWRRLAEERDACRQRIEGAKAQVGV